LVENVLDLLAHIHVLANTHLECGTVLLLITLHETNCSPAPLFVAFFFFSTFILEYCGKHKLGKEVTFRVLAVKDTQ
jgi:uncharacterized membrane protein YozB (DUF420 family)